PPLASYFGLQADRRTTTTGIVPTHSPVAEPVQHHASCRWTRTAEKRGRCRAAHRDERESPVWSQRAQLTPPHLSLAVVDSLLPPWSSFLLACARLAG